VKNLVRKNAVPVWIDYVGDICCVCGQKLQEGTQILNAKYCESCSQKKEKEISLKKKEEILWMEYRSVCVKCAKKFQIGDKVLFGIYCKSCGKLREKERILTQPKLKKARGIPEVQLNAEMEENLEENQEIVNESIENSPPKKVEILIVDEKSRHIPVEESPKSSKKSAKNLQTRLL
jgi:hypothetical protein